MKLCHLCGRVRWRCWNWYDHKAEKLLRFDSQHCVNWWTHMYPDQQEELNRVELEAIEASLPELGVVVAEIGMDKPVSEYQREDVLRLIFTAYKATKAHMAEIISRESPPL